MRLHTRLARAKLGLERRMFLKAVAVGLSVPIAVKLSRMATAGVGAAPKRLLLYFLPHGIPPEHINPKVSESDNRDFTLADTNVSVWGPLEPYKQWINVYEGIQYIGDAGTHDGIKNCLSGLTQDDSTTPRTTFERVIAKGLGVKPLILGACAHLPFGLDPNGMLYWDGTPVDPEKDPSKVADELFGSLGNDAPQVDVNVELRKELLGLTASEIQSLSSELDGLTSEQSKLQAHLDAIQTIQNSEGTGSGVSACSMAPSLPSVDKVRQQSAGQIIDPSGGNDYFYQEANFPLLFDAQMEVATQALICNSAQVIGFQSLYATCDFDFGFAGAGGAHHSTLSHTAAQPAPGAQYDSPITIENLLPETRVPFATAQRWFFEKLADKLISVLATTDDPAAPGTTVLDNTLIYCFSEIGDGQTHQRISRVEYPQYPAYLPCISIGGCGGAISTGQVLQFPIGPENESRQLNRPATDLYLTFARAFGVNDATFTGTTGVIEGVLT